MALAPGAWPDLRCAVERSYPAFPTNACAATLTTLLRQAGFNVAFTASAREAAHSLERSGWQKVKSPRPGDVGVCVDRNAIPGPDHVWLVARVVGGEVWAFDNRAIGEFHGLYRRNVGRGEFTPVDYFLRWPVE